jgi:hypothetical protein
MSWRHGRPRMWRLLASSVTAIGLMPVLLTPTLANATTAKVDKPNASLTASWWQKFVAIPGNPLDRCDVGTKKILFLAGTTGIEPGQPGPTRTCTTDKVKTFLVPLINVECSTLEGNGRTFKELRRCAAGDFADHFTDLKLVIDGQAVGNLNSLRVKAESTFTPVPGNVFFPTLTHPKKSKFASDGYWALIKLTPGKHTLTFGGSFVPVPGDPPAFRTEVTYHLDVKK